MPSIDISDLVSPVPPAPEAIDVALPGGLVIRGMANEIGSSALANARALLSAANAGLAPLGPVFAIIDAILAIKAFADAVPEIVVNPGVVVEKIVELGQKVGRLAALIPQLSVPLIMIGIVDAVLALLDGLIAELVVLQQQEERNAATRETALSFPEGPARVALQGIADACDSNAAQHRANLATALSSVGPLLQIVSIFAELVGLDPISAEVEAGEGTGALIESLEGLVTTLQTVRSAIPV